MLDRRGAVASSDISLLAGVLRLCYAIPMNIDLSPVYAAIDQGQPDLMEDLLSPMEESVPQKHKDALLGYCLNQRRGDEAMVALYAGADPNALDDRGNTLLMRSMQNMDMESVVLLLVSGADPNLANVHGETAAHAAARQDVPVALELLARYGARLDIANNEGSSPAQEAVRHGSANTLGFLLRSGVDYAPSALLPLARSSEVSDLLQSFGVENAPTSPARRRMGM